MTRKRKPDPATDARESRNLESWAFGWKQELMPVARFIDSVDRGKTPAAEDMQHIAAAMRALFCHRDLDASLSELASRLQLRRKQGQRGQTAEEASRGEAMAWRVALREEELIGHGLVPRRAQGQALRDVARREGVPLRTCQGWWREHRDHIRPLMRWRAESPPRNENPG